MALQTLISGSYATPFEDGGTPSPVSLTQTANTPQRADFSRSYDAPVTDDVVSLGTLAAAGAKTFIIKVKTGSCSVKLNGSTVPMVLSVPGAYFMFCDPNAGWLTAATISTTGPAVVLFLAGG